MTFYLFTIKIIHQIKSSNHNYQLMNYKQRVPSFLALNKYIIISTHLSSYYYLDCYLFLDKNV